MKSLEELSNSELFIEIKEMMHEYEAIKMEMLAQLNKMDEIEKRHKKAQEILIKRLKR